MNKRNNKAFNKKLSPTQKKIDNNVRRALLDASEQLLNSVDGFQWLSHRADYSDFPASLLVSCVFDTDVSKHKAIASGDSLIIQKLVHSKLLKIGVILQLPKRQVVFGSEESHL